MILTNDICWRQAQRVLVGGVNSPVRSFQGVGGRPFFVSRGKGPFVFDVEGKRYLDYVGSWGALPLGHANPAVIQNVRNVLRWGTTFGTPTPSETKLAQQIIQAFPSMEQIRFVSSGTEAVMSALRLARAATGRTKIIKFDGAYHGHSDALLTNAGSGLATLGLPSSPGVPGVVTRETITVPWNNPQAVDKVIRQYPNSIACVILEPILANIGLIPPDNGFLQSLRKMTRQRGILLIFDEVITGFRVAYGGAQQLYQIEPDITILGKIIGGGFPIGAYGARKKLMQKIAPAGPVYQAGTLAGHPISMTAGSATLAQLKRPGTYEQLHKKGKNLAEGLRAISQRYCIPVKIHQVGSLLTLFFTDGPVRNGQEARRTSPSLYARYFQGMLQQGVYLPPSAFEAWFISLAHGDQDIEKTLCAHERVLSRIAGGENG